MPHSTTPYTLHSTLRQPVLAGRRLRGALLFLLATPSLTGCYLLQAAQGQMAIGASRQLVSAVLANPATPQKLRARLEYIAAARNFASRELGLPDNDSYRSYADLQRPYVVWNVFATGEFSVEPRRWCFPVAGCVVYRGYFHEEAAQSYARRLRFRGYDTAVGGVAAYSTLGHFKDPVLNTMMSWSDAQLASTLFHELAHQVAYASGDSEFNESFATVVENVGIERWLAAGERWQDLRAWRVQRQRQAQFIELLLTTRERLESLYQSTLPDSAKRDRKQYQFGKLKLAYAQLKREWGGFAGYDRWFERTLNNAHLAPAATYHGCVPGLQRLLASVEGDLSRFYQQAKRLAAEKKEHRQRLVCQDAPQRQQPQRAQ